MSCDTRLRRRRRTPPRGISAVVVALAVVSLAGCAGHASGVDKAGGQGRPVTLLLGTPDSDGQPDSPLIKYFADQVRVISGGRLRIKIDFLVAGEAANYEQLTVRKVRDGTLDLGWVGSRVWDTQGVLAFQALQAPFLITNHPLLDRVLTSPIAGDMLAELKHIGMIGLALYPDELRHPVGFGRPLLSLADFRGARIRVPASTASDELMRALGAQPVHVNGTAMAEAIDSGELRGIESSIGNAALVQGRPVVTANIILFAKAPTLFADANRFAALSGAQQGLLRTAARRTLDFALHRRTEAADAKRLCALGGAVALAGPSEIAEVVRAGQSLYPQLERDARTRSFITQIRQMKAAVGATTTAPAPCGITVRTHVTVLPDGASTPQTPRFLYEHAWTLRRT